MSLRPKLLFSRYTIKLLISLYWIIGIVRASAYEIELKNPLLQHWPWELISHDLPVETTAGWSSVAFSDRRLPIQIEQLPDGKTVRVWHLVQFPTTKTVDQRNRETVRTAERLRLKFSQDPPDEGTQLVVEELADVWQIQNGCYALRLLKIDKSSNEPQLLNALPHWLQGVRRLPDGRWDGRAQFRHDQSVKIVKSELIHKGPVFVDYRIVYSASIKTEGSCKALPLEMSKQTFRWQPNRPPYAETAKYEQYYEAVVRCVYRDPWIEINERMHVPAAVPTLYRIHFGKPQGVVGLSGLLPEDQYLDIDTALWARWFEYDRFGGNSRQLVLPALSRPEQKGRPFANLQPRWTQRGGFSQELFLAGGGNGKEGTTKPDPQADSVGIVTAYASKWVNPGALIVRGYVEDGNRGWFEFPADNGSASNFHYAQRCYALCIGARGEFEGNERLNRLIRRHTDWTLNALVNRYVLQWERDPQKAGPHIAITRERLAQLRTQYLSTTDNPTKTILQKAHAALAALREEQKALTEQEKQWKARVASGEISNEPEKLTQLQNRRKAVEGQLRAQGYSLLELIVDNKQESKSMPGAGGYIGQRYQEDFLNPTSGGTRSLPRGLLPADLFSDGKPQGGAEQAALGYVFCDLDHWPGWHQGWHPGNPNFHTDKYQIALYLAASMLDHPHAQDWLQFARENFEEDLRLVLLPPDGVGYECPGYSAYSFRHQLELARIFLHCGFGNLVAANPLFKASANWHRNLLTPVDPRLGFRHEAPHGDTHRWRSGLDAGYAMLASFYQHEDRAFASELLGMFNYQLGRSPFDGPEGIERLVYLDPELPTADPAGLDWSSRHYYGFGTIMRQGFGERESFVSMKAGLTHGHYHNDELAFHYYAENTPLALDYNCSYSPRGDHAALHNSMTFGLTGTVVNNTTGKTVEAMEQIHGQARVLAFKSLQVADVVIAERGSKHLRSSPPEPRDAEFARGYPVREVSPIRHRRLLALVKHEPEYGLRSYLAIKDETTSTEPQQLNVHLLVRDVEIREQAVYATGQWDKNVALLFHTQKPVRIERRRWYYYDSNSVGPVAVVCLPGESTDQWRKRIAPLLKDSTAQLGGTVEQWRERIAQTDGMALIPPPGWSGHWMHGEYQVWLRLHLEPGDSIFWVFYPYKPDESPPSLVARPDGSYVLQSERSTDELYLSSTLRTTSQAVFELKSGERNTLVLSAEEFEKKD